MAGKGQRLIDAGILTPKPLLEVGGKTLAEHSITTLGMPNANFVFVTRPFEDVEDNNKLNDIFNSLNINFGTAFIETGEHRGSAHSSLYAQRAVEALRMLDQPLIVTNCDQILKWDADKFLKFVNDVNADGAVILYKSNNSKNSFAIVKNGLVSEIVEKNPVSDDALIGIHYWKHAKDFFKSAKELVKLSPYGKEAYVSETYNFLINSGKKIYAYWLGEDEKFIPIGTPEDIESYLNDNN